jgi:hypothetical protein
VRAADAALIRQLEDALGARVDRLVNRVAEPQEPAAGGMCLARDPLRVRVVRLRLFEQAGRTPLPSRG